MESIFDEMNRRYGRGVSPYDPFKQPYSDPTRPDPMPRIRPEPAPDADPGSLMPYGPGHRRGYPEGVDPSAPVEPGRDMPSPGGPPSGGYTGGSGGTGGSLQPRGNFNPQGPFKTNMPGPPQGGSFPEGGGAPQQRNMMPGDPLAGYQDNAAFKWADDYFMSNYGKTLPQFMDTSVDANGAFPAPVIDEVYQVVSQYDQRLAEALKQTMEQWNQSRR